MVELTDKPFIAFLAIMITIQLPLEASLVIVSPIFIVDYFKKKIKKGVDKDDKYCIMKARSVN